VVLSEPTIALGGRLKTGGGVGVMTGRFRVIVGVRVDHTKGARCQQPSRERQNRPEYAKGHRIVQVSQTTFRCVNIIVSTLLLV
jgi:hypothetical protein